MSTLNRSAAGFALLAALAAGCGSVAQTRSGAVHPKLSSPAPATAPAKPAAAKSSHPAAHPSRMPSSAPAMPPAAPPAPAPPAVTPTVAPPPPQAPPPAMTPPPAPVNPIPQGNGGDQDGDNNGGPSDGDGTSSRSQLRQCWPLLTSAAARLHRSWKEA